MDREKIIHQWQEKRKGVTVPENFSAGVMAEIQTRKAEPVYDAPCDDIRFSNRFFEWAAASGLVLLGLFRILYIVANLFRPHLAMP